MRLVKLLKKSYNELSVHTLGATFDSPVGVSIFSKSPASKVTFLCDCCYSFGIIGSGNLSATISKLLSAPMDTNVFHEIDSRAQYVFDGRKKSAEAAFAILYDLVDGFIISGFDDLQENVDPLINQRMYNDHYRPIILRVDDRLIQEDLDEIISFSMLSNIDGLLLSSIKLLEYASERSNGSLTLIYQCHADVQKVREALAKGASLVAVNSGRFPLLSPLAGKKIIKKLYLDV